VKGAFGFPVPAGFGQLDIFTQDLQNIELLFDLVNNAILQKFSIFNFQFSINAPLAGRV